MTRILSVASECTPFVKTGGLADVVGALPAAMAGQGCEMRVLLPGYPAVMEAVKGAAGSDASVVMQAPDLFGGPATVLSARHSGIDLLIIDAPHLYARPGSIYAAPDRRDWPDNPERFAALSWIAARIGTEGAGGWQPQVLHLHDWQAGLTPVYLRDMGGAGRVATVLSIHNIAFHGLSPNEKLERLRLSWDDFTPGGFEYYNQIGALKAGIVFADCVATVSPTYARELMTPEFGMGLNGVLQARPDGVTGILNGIDTTAWDPATDPALAARFTTPRGKKANRKALMDEMGLPDGDGPLCVVVSRLTPQKGLDLLQEALPALLDGGGRLALLGAGDEDLEQSWLRAAEDPAVSVTIGYDEALSHRMIAGADAILVPSRFEPCGLTQLYALRYGTVPVVGLTGGLADTVVNANDAAMKRGCATGIQFHPVTAPALARALGQLTEIYRTPDDWARLQRNAMRHPVGWDSSAADYAQLYQRLIDAK